VFKMRGGGVYEMLSGPGLAMLLTGCLAESVGAPVKVTFVPGSPDPSPKGKLLSDVALLGFPA